MQPDRDLEQDSGTRHARSDGRRTLGAGWALTWRIAATLAAGSVLGLALGGVVLAASRDLVTLDTARSASAAFGLAAGTVLTLLLAGAVTLAVTANGIALLVRDHLDAPSTAVPRLRLGGSLVAAVVAVPRSLLFVAVAVPTVLALVVLAPVVTLAVLVHAGWRLARRTVPRPQALTGLLAAVPLAAALRAAAAAPALYASLLNRAPLRAALRAARGQRLRARVLALAGLVAVLAVNVVLTGLTVTGLQAGPAFYGVLGLTLLLAGAGVGVLAHAPARTGGEGTGVVPPGPEQRRPRRRLRLRLRQARVAAVTAFAVLVGTIGVATPALAAPADAPAAIVVGTTADPTVTVDPAQCQDGAPCGIRAALAVAAARAADTGSATVTFDAALDGQTITLAGTLTVAAGVTVDTHGNAVTLDAHHAFRALQAVAPGNESPQVTLRGLHVTGGRVPAGGAGLYSDTARVELVGVTFTDNVAGGSGGAVALPGGRLTVSGSTFTGNSAGGVGGALAAGAVVVQNSTLVDNTGSGTTGGAVSVTGGGQVSQVTVSGAGGLAGSTGSPLLVTNTLVTGPAGSWVACSAIATGADGQSPSAGNVDAAGTCLGRTADPQPLGALADNGGTTRTMLPGAGNPALAAGSAQWCEYTDQRSQLRPPAACDAGAVQVSAEPPAATPPAPVQTELATVDLLLNPADRFPAGAPLVFRATVYPGTGGTSTAGTLQMVENGTLLGAPVEVDEDDANYELTVPALSQGPHTVVLRHVPTGGRTRQDSAPLRIGVTVPSKVTVTTAAPVQVGDPATLVATVGDDPGNGPALDPNAPRATGTATFRYDDGQSADVAVVDGVATLHVDSLTSPAATVVYGGDEWYAEGLVDQFDLFGADVPTRTTATVSTPEVQLGEQTQVAVRVTDSRGAAPSGLVHLVVGGTERDLERLVGGAAALSAALPLGTSTGYVTFEPDAGWSGSRSSDAVVTVVPVHSSIALTYDGAHPAAWPDAPSLPFTATGEHGPATVQLLAGSTVLAEQQVSLPATGSFVLPVGSYDVGTRTLHAQLGATPTMAGARSADVPVTIVPGTTTVTLSPGPGAQVGVPQTVTVHAGGSRPATLVVTRDDGREVAHQQLPASGDDTFTATPLAVRTQLTATVTYADGRYARAASSTTVTADAATPAAAQLSWTSTGTAADTAPAQLAVRYPAGAGLPAPTGSVTLRDRVGAWVGYGTLVDGAVTVALRGEPGQCYCGASAVTVSYSGDGVYAPRGDTAPDVTHPGRATTTSLVVTTANLRPGQPVAMTVRVTTPTGTPAGEVAVSLGDDVFATGTLVDGRADVAGTVPAGATGPVTLTARYLPALPAWNASSAVVAATVVPFAPPSVVLSVGPGVHRLGVAESLSAAVRSSDPGAPLDTSAGLEVRDDTGALVGTGTWLPNGAAYLTITPVHGGDRTLTATYRYGDGRQGTSQPLALRVQGVLVPLTVTAQGPAAVGRHVVVRVTGQVPAGVTSGPLTVQSYVGGQPTGVVTPLVADASGTLDATLSVVPERKGQVDLLVVSQGDGADVERASGGTTLTVAPATMTLRPVTGLLAPVTYGSRFTTPAVVLDGSYGSTPDGRLDITLVDSAGVEHPGCRATLPETRCEVETQSLDPGTYTLAHRLSGSAVFDDVPRVLGAQVPLQLARTTVDTRFSTVPGLWVAGQEVTATFGVRDTLTTSGDATGVLRLDSTYGPLCQLDLTDGRTAECTFTVPWPAGAPTGELDQRLTTTFTPTSRFTTGSDDVSLFRAPLRCYTATSDRSYAVTFDSGVPVVAGGQACDSAGPTGDRAGSAPGFVEGSQLTVSADLARTGPGWAFTGMTATPAGGAGYLLAATAGSDRVLTTPLTGNTRFVPSYRWAPTCVEVSTGYEDLEGLGRSRADYAVYTSWREGAVVRPANSVLLETPSNCGQPFGGMTTEERADYAQGVGHYLVGTQVQVQPVTSNPYTPTAERPDWALQAMPGATKDAAGFWHLTARPGPHGEPVVAYGVWRWSPRMCAAVETGAGAGGTVAVTGSSFPRSLAPMEDPTGACVTASGGRGFLAGTTVTATATPTNTRTSMGWRPAIGESYLYRWPTGSAEVRGSGTVQPTSEVPGRSGGISGDPYAAHTATAVVALDRGTYFGATFARIDCVPVTLALTGLTVAGAGLTPGTCDAVPGDQVADGRTVRYYTGGTRVAFDPAVPTKKDAYDRSVALRWKAEVTGTDGAQTLTFGPSGAFDVRRTTTGAVLTASYVLAACREVRLAAPQLPGYSTFVSGGDCPQGESDGTQTQASAVVPDAARANGVLPQWKILSRDPKAVLSGLDNPAMSSRDTYPLVSHYDTIIYRGQLNVDLMYCRPVADLVTVALVDAVGHPLGSWGAPDPARTMGSYNDRCVGNDVPVQASSQLDLTDDAKRKWTVVGWKNDRTGQLSLTDLSPRTWVEADGTALDHWTLLVQPRCYRLETGDRVSALTAPTCAGQDPAKGLYTAGTVVDLTFADDYAITLQNWKGVSSSSGSTAQATMDGDRQVSVYWTERHVSGAEKAVQVLSNVGQRFVAGVMTATNLFVLEPIAGILAVGPVFGAIADGLSAIGLGGAVADGLRSLGTLMSKTSDALNAWGSCTTAWATGSEDVSGVLTASGTTKTALDGAESGAGKAAGVLDKRYATDSFSSGLKDVGTLRDTINLFTTNFSAYTQDPEKAWGGMVDSLNDCFKSKAEGVVDAGSKMGG